VFFYPGEAMQKLTFMLFVLFSLPLLAFDKFDNSVCESLSSDKQRIGCFKEFGLAPDCKNASSEANELDCYRKIANTLVSEQQEQAKQTEKQVVKKASMPKTLSEKYLRQMYPGALSPYTQKGYPKTVAKYKSRLPEIEEMRRKAVEMAIDSGKCDFVELVELSDSKSTIDNLQFWIDCKNKQRLYFSETQLKSGAPVLTQEEKSWTKESAIAACREAIKARTLIPSEVDINEILGTSFYKAPGTYNVVLKMNFDAKNAYGIEIPYTATCYLPPGEVGTIEISSR
jgi:hypothetical protein